MLSLFPGIGLLDKAFEEEGFCVVRGPDVIWGGDIRTFHPPLGKFNGIIGGPPCQMFSSLAHLVRANGYEPKFGNLIPELERCIAEARPHWFLMENVPAAPEPVVKGYSVTSFLLDNSMLDSGDGWGEEQRRVRRFSFGLATGTAPDLRRWIDMAVFVLPKRHTAVNAGHDDANVSLTEKRLKRKRTCIGGGTLTPGAELNRTGERTRDGQRNSRVARLADALRLQGLPEDFLDHCPFTAEGKLKAVANGVPIMMGRAIARAVKQGDENMSYAWDMSFLGYCVVVFFVITLVLKAAWYLFLIGAFVYFRLTGKIKRSEPSEPE